MRVLMALACALSTLTATPVWCKGDPDLPYCCRQRPDGTITCRECKGPR